MFPHSLAFLTRTYLQGLIIVSVLLSTARICELPPPLFSHQEVISPADHVPQGFCCFAKSIPCSLLPATQPRRPAIPPTGTQPTARLLTGLLCSSGSVLIGPPSLNCDWTGLDCGLQLRSLRSSTSACASWGLLSVAQPHRPATRPTQPQRQLVCSRASSDSSILIGPPSLSCDWTGLDWTADFSSTPVCGFFGSVVSGVSASCCSLRDSLTSLRWLRRDDPAPTPTA